MKNKELRIFAIALWLVLTFCEAILAHNTLYTQGEVWEGFYWLVVSFNIPILYLVVWQPRIGLWATLALGALVLPGHVWDHRKWTLLHEEVFALVDHLKTRKEKEGIYPPTLRDYRFQRDGLRDNIRYIPHDGTYRIDYHMHDKSVSYWYTPEGGFGYYPD